jgi:hypothetical protein
MTWRVYSNTPAMQLHSMIWLCRAKCPWKTGVMLTSESATNSISFLHDLSQTVFYIFTTKWKIEARNPELSLFVIWSNGLCKEKSLKLTMNVWSLENNTEIDRKFECEAHPLSPNRGSASESEEYPPIGDHWFKPPYYVLLCASLHWA